MLKVLRLRIKLYRKFICIKHICGVVLMILLLIFYNTIIRPNSRLDTTSNEIQKSFINRLDSQIGPEDNVSSGKSVPFEKATTSTSLKILCYILLSRSKVRTALLIKNTWGSHCDELLFFGGYDYPDLPVTRLNVSEGYENLWGKTKAVLLFLSKNSRYKKFDYFLKADDDTFVIIENLRTFLSNSKMSLNEPAWSGFKLKHKQIPQGYMSGGAGYVYNYKALEKVTKLLRQGVTTPINELTLGACNTAGVYGMEDLELGKCFLAAGVKSINSVDTKGRERFLPLSYDTFLNGDISSFHWVWRQAWNRIRTGEDCCTKDIISMHEISPRQMKLIYNLLYQIRYNGK